MQGTFAVYKRRTSEGEWQLVSEWDDELMACSLARAHINIDHSKGFPEVEALVIKVDGSNQPLETVGNEAIKDSVLWASDGTHDPKFIALTEHLDKELALRDEREGKQSG